MPVDLSRIGLEGIETAQRTLNAIEARKASQVAREVEMGKFQREEADRQLDELALNNARSIAEGRGINIDDPNTSAEDYVEYFNTVGEQYLKAGAPKRGKEFIEAGIDYLKKKTDIDKAEDDAEQTRLENMEKAGAWVAQNIGENESEYQLFLSNLDDPDNPVADILGRENVQVLKSTPWSPDLTNYFRSKAISITDQARLALSERGHIRAERSAETLSRRYQALEDIARANLKERQREQTWREKSGGGNIGKAATNAEIGTAKSVILNTVEAFEGTPPEKGSPEETALSHMAEDIAGRAKLLVDQNKGITYSDAVNQAVAEANAAGDFSILEVTEDTWKPAFLEKTVKQGSYKRRGTRPDNPIPLPEDRSKWVKGRYYEFNGKVGRYGTDFE